jgi:hypothetical protein
MPGSRFMSIACWATAMATDADSGLRLLIDGNSEAPTTRLSICINPVEKVFSAMWQPRYPRIAVV